MRIKSIFRNSVFALLSQIILIIAGFFSQRVLNLEMGRELVGVNGTISNVIALLSVTELGISTAIVYHLYAAISENDHRRIAQLMNLYRKAYRIFAGVITLAGLPVCLFIPRMVKDNGFADSFIRILYLLWLVRTALSYLMSYKRSILIADQNEYIVSITTLGINLLNYLLSIAILLTWHNYPAVLIANTLVELIINFILNQYIDRRYPYLVKERHTQPDRKTFSKIMTDVRNIFVTRLASKLLLSTDNLIISGLIGTGIAGLYSNYTMITQSVLNIVLALSQAIQPGAGHLFLENESEKSYQFLRRLSFLFFWITSVVGTCLISLSSRFVTEFWLNSSFMLQDLSVICLTANACILILTTPLAVVVNVSGLFSREKSVSLIVAAVNLAVSLLLVRPLGLPGVMLGTFCAYLVQFALRTQFFFDHFSEMNRIQYLLDMAGYFFLAVAETAIMYLLSSHLFAQKGFLHFLLVGITAVLFPLAVNWILYRKSKRMQGIYEIFRMLTARSGAH